jgi:2-hydroxy-3-keto-5-methylthiopentenyl-1-phosphate phosphatase
MEKYVDASKKSFLKSLLGDIDLSNFWFGDDFWLKYLKLDAETSAFCERGGDPSDLWQILTDFDHTISHPLGPQCHDIIADNTPEAMSKELRQTLSNAPALRARAEHKPGDFWRLFNNIMKEHGFEKGMLTDMLTKEPIEMRDGADEFFDVCESDNIPILVASAGFENIIEIALERSSLLRSNVSLFANRMYFEDEDMAAIRGRLPYSMSSLHLTASQSLASIDEDLEESPDGRLQSIKDDTDTETDLDTESELETSASPPLLAVLERSKSKLSSFGPLIHTTSKHELYDFCRDHFDGVGRRPFAFAIGDSLGDAVMATSVKHIKVAIKIGFCKFDVHKDKERLEQYKKDFDMLILEPHAGMHAITALLRFFTSDRLLVNRGGDSESEEVLKAPQLRHDVFGGVSDKYLDNVLYRKYLFSVD